MFGYIQPDIRLLRIYEYERYKAVYCGVCHAMGQRLGSASRVGLSYDFAFFALLLASLKEIETVPEQGRCAVVPLRKLPLFKNETILQPIADYCVLLRFLKAQDDIQDRNLSGRLKKIAYQRAFDELKARKLGLCAAAEEIMQKQRRLEKNACAVIDEAAHPSAELIGKICADMGGETVLEQSLYAFGYMLGRWVYLMDAAADRAADARKKNYNPFNICQTDPLRIEEMLNWTLREVMEAFDRLELETNISLLNNIIYQGLKKQQDSMLKGKKNVNDRPL